jgi:RimJ/RimL family protein N-acetyltransferase
MTYHPSALPRRTPDHRVLPPRRSVPDNLIACREGSRKAANMRFPDDVPNLTSADVTLRAHCSDDVEGVYEQCNDPLSQQWTTVPVPYRRDDAVAFVQRRRAAWEQNEDWSFAIEAPGGGGASRFGGTVSIGRQGVGIGELAFGTHPGVRGKGVMTTAVRLILDWAFQAQGLHTVIWRCNAGNYASWRVAWKNGFTFEGTSRASLPQRGEALDAWQGTLLANDSRAPKTSWLRPARLQNDGVVLRDLVPNDAQRFIEATTDAESLRWLADVPLARTREEFDQMYRDRLLQATLGSAVRWVVADALNARYLGVLTLFGLHSLDYASAEVGYHTHPDARGRGVMTRALRAALAHAFAAASAGGLGLQRISLGTAPGNAASGAVARACGFTETGRDRRCYRLFDGSIVDLLRFDLLAEEFSG